MSFTTRETVRFAHVDAAGIVFYPRYFEMVNAALEDFFAGVIGIDFHTLHLVHGLGVPTVRLDSRFHAPSRLGDELEIGVAVDKVGSSSATLTFSISCAGEARLTVQSVIVCMDLKTGRPVPWREEMRGLRALSVEQAA